MLPQLGRESVALQANEDSADGKIPYSVTALVPAVEFSEKVFV
jgi:hypothetical protein